MPRQQMTAKELVASTFSPRVAVLCSRVAESICEKNNLSFVQLIQPFTTLTTELTWQEPSGQHVIARPLRINPVDIASWKPSETDAQKNRLILNTVVSHCPPPLYNLNSDQSSGLFKLYKLGTRTSEYQVEIPEYTPWFSVYRETFLKLHSEQQHNHHEFLHHFIGCILVISSSEVKTTEELASIIGKLSKLQQQHQIEWPHTWILPSVIKFYLILHDSSAEDLTLADTMYQNLRTIYGGNFCYMLTVNSASPTEEMSELIADPWAPYIQQDFRTDMSDNFNDLSKSYEATEAVVRTDVMHPLSPDSELSPFALSQNGEFISKQRNSTERRGKSLSLQDLQNIQVAINEFLGKALLPYVERQTRLLHESILNRRGMSKSFFSATKRLFGSTAKPTASVLYTPESPEMMSRKLADIYFLFGNYSGAYQLYHQIKKDFSADCAWTHYASSLEMAALSHFMMTQSTPPLAMARSFPVHYVNEAIGHYIDHCRMPDAAIRCAIVCCECLKHMENYGEAAAILIRMTSEDCDLRSALMLEQAAYTFLKMNSPRKYALHSVLAGHRYAKAGLKIHSLNSYLQAGQAYANRGWRFAEDHVRFTIARHQCNLQLFSGISQHLKSLLITPSPQPAQQIQIFFKEFLTIMARLWEEGGVPQEFFIPKIRSDDIVVRIAMSDLPTGEINNINVLQETTPTSWDTLEEQIVRECVNNSILQFKPSRLLFHKGTDNTVFPTVPSNETFYVEVPIENPLSIEVCLSSVVLKFDQQSSISCSMIDNLRMNPEETKNLRFGISSSTVGVISIVKLFYYIDFGVLRVPFEQCIIAKGPRLNSTKSEKSGRFYAKDYRNKINIVDQMPLIQAEVEDLPKSLFQAQTTFFNLHLKDRAIDTDQRKRITRVVIASENMKDYLEVKSDSANGFQLETSRQHFCPIRMSFDGASSSRIPCLFRVPQMGDIASLNILILYQFQATVIGSTTSLHRVIKVSIKVPLAPCLRLEYSKLKLIDAVTSLALLRVHNITQTETIFIDSLQLKPSEVTIKDVNSGSEIMSPNDIQSRIKVAPFESTNLIMKINGCGNIADTKTSISLAVKWHIRENQYDSSVENHKAAGYYHLEMGDRGGDIPTDNSFIFQIKHESRKSNDFHMCPSFIFPVQLLVYPRTTGEISLSLEKSHQTESEPNQTLQASSQEVFFVGKKKWVLHVESCQMKTLEYQVVVHRPGIYNVAPTLTVTNSKSGAQQIFPLHSPIIISHLPTTT